MQDGGDNYQRGAFEGEVLNRLENIETTLKRFEDNHSDMQNEVDKNSDFRKGARWFGVAIVVLSGLASKLTSLLTGK